MKKIRVQRFAAAHRLAGRFAAAFLQVRPRARHPALPRAMAVSVH
ncbi:hypothetical protein [uncultured Methylibium sp.]|nr:hypothetical protein [uncultured Methylibium sp.]